MSQSTEVLADELRRHGVPVTCTDSAEHGGEKVTPIKCAWRDYELYELAPNTQELSKLQLLKAIEVTELNKLPFRSPDGIRRFFNLALAIYEDRDKHVADPRYYQAPTEKILSATYLRERLGMGASRQGVLSPNGTTPFVVSDKYGNLLGFIQSIFDNFGSGITVHDIPFQNRGAQFAKKSGLPNSPAPSERLAQLLGTTRWSDADAVCYVRIDFSARSPPPCREMSMGIRPGFEDRWLPAIVIETSPSGLITFEKTISQAGKDDHPIYWKL